jgi:hypothetical protein
LKQVFWLFGGILTLASTQDPEAGTVTSADGTIFKGDVIIGEFADSHQYALGPC